MIWENLPTKVVLPGVTNSEDLRALSYLAGQRWVQRTTRGHSEGADGRASYSTSRTPTLEPVVAGHTISSMPRWHAYVLGLGRHPAIVSYTPGYLRVAARAARASRTSRLPPRPGRRRTRRRGRSCNCPRPAGGPDDRADPDPDTVPGASPEPAPTPNGMPPAAAGGAGPAAGPASSPRRDRMLSELAGELRAARDEHRRDVAQLRTELAGLSTVVGENADLLGQVRPRVA